ncbi:ParB/RepB/Spo0J family partition protein [Serratia bockelmannii]|uniref:ParB/RepB/Spo0J family partition protein n=1 Tax=Serratia bockelmannii TaxID=2703793 RepID=UPI003FA6EC1C
MANSINKLIDEKIIKRGKTGMLIRLDDIHIQEGFNKREDDERTQLADDELLQFILNGGIIPALEVRPRDEGGVWVVEGHRRTRAYKRAREAGRPIEWISITPFIGNDVERIARIMNSNNQLPLTPFEQSQVIKALSAYNLSPDEIARLVNKSRATIDKLLALGLANHDVQSLVKDGSVAVDAALDRVKEHGESAGKVLSGDIAKAKAAGKKKVTKSFITQQFSAQRARRLCELLYYAAPMVRTEGDVLLLSPGTKDEVNAILNEYRQLQTKE